MVKVWATCNPAGRAGVDGERVAAHVELTKAAVPVEIQRRTVEPDATGRAFTYHATPPALLVGARALHGHAPQATLITVTGADLSLRHERSPVVGWQCLNRACLNRALRPAVAHSKLQGSDLDCFLEPYVTTDEV